MDDTITKDDEEDTYTLDDDEIRLEPHSTTSLARATRGRFAKGNQEGRKFQKGYAGKPKGARNRKTLIAREFAEDVLYLNPQTGKQMTYHELCLWVKKKAEVSPRILNLLLDHALGKPVELVQQTQRVFIMTPDYAQDNTQDAEVVDDEQRCLIIGRKQEEEE